MKKLHVVILALVAMFALTAMLASTASAEVTLLAEWLVSGVGVTTLTSVFSLGKMLLEDKTFGAAIECEGTFDGSVGPNGEGEITELLTEGGVLVNAAAPLTVANGGCKYVSGCSTSAPAEVYALGFPWHTLLSIIVATAKFTVFLFKKTSHIVCTLLGIKATDECTETNASFEVLASAEGAEGTGKVAPAGTCTVGGTGAGVQEFKGANHMLTLGEIPVIPSST
jgi:hypothetical protein